MTDRLHGRLRTGRESLAGLAGRLAKRGIPTWVLGGLVALLTWEVQFGAPRVGLDASWRAGLEMALHRGLEFGPQVAFTYGPLGFLRDTTVWYGDLAVIAFLYAAAIYVGLAISLVWALRRTLDAVPAVFVALAVLALLPPIEQPLVIAMAWSLGLLARSPAPKQALWGVLVGGASLAAAESLIKVSVGPVIFAVCLLALIGARVRWWQAAVFVGLYGVEILLLWLGAGQSIGDLPDFVENTAQVVSGYSQAMGLGAPTLQEPVAIVTLLGFAALSAFAAYRDERARWFAVAIIAIAGFAIFKQGLVRPEAGHVAFFFSTAATLWLVLPWSQAQRGLLIAGAVVMAALAVHVEPMSGNLNLDLIGNVRNAGTQARNLLSSGRRADVTEQGREAMKGVYLLDGRTLSELRGHSVSVDPWEIGVVWAYDLDWAPLPVFQNYSAYTEHLDELNAAEVENPDGPQRILRANPPLVDAEYPTRTIDGRYPGWDPPAQSRATLCHFAPLYTTDRWQVLGRIPNRCGPPQPIRSIDAGYGEQVSIPSAGAGEVVFVRIHGAEVGGLERLRSLLLRAKTRYAVLDGNARYRLIPGTAADGLLLRGSARVGGSGPYAQIPNASTIELTGSSGDLRYDFFRMPVHETGGKAGAQRRPVQ